MQLNTKLKFIVGVRGFTFPYIGVKGFTFPHRKQLQWPKIPLSNNRPQVECKWNLALVLSLEHMCFPIIWSGSLTFSGETFSDLPQFAIISLTL